MQMSQLQKNTQRVISFTGDGSKPMTGVIDMKNKHIENLPKSMVVSF